MNLKSNIKCTGVALIVVLSLLVLITITVVGFIGRVGSDRAASGNYYAAAATRQLADTAVSLVQAQINEASNSGSNAWVSQPGAVRVYDNSGQLEKIYRLYSAPTLVSQVNDARVLANDIPPTDWSKYPAQWVDLNAPVVVSTGSAGASGSDAYCSFPILDPRDPANPGTVSAPIVMGTNTLAGFSLTGTVPGATTAQPVPMPVQWLYVLQNGQIVAPAASSGNTVTVANASGSNPIIGRIAFWTDDECAKVNINTACGSISIRPDSSTGNSGTAALPAPWDAPRFTIGDEMRLFSKNQPVKGEFQRYPGHPATTDLYGIFSGLGLPMNGTYPPAPDVGTYLSGSNMPAATNTATQSGMMTYTPRYGDANSSQAGTADTTKASTSGTPPIVADQTLRLYTSVGEMYFNSSTNSRVSNGLTRQQIETGKFFLTAHSRAPETTLFGTPRISMWPIDSDYASNPVLSNTTPLVSAYDKLISFCTTTGTGANRHIYYIQRHDSTSGANDYVNILRNQDLYGYLQRMTNTQIPGYGGTFANKYGNAGRDQILTEMVDYIRCTNVIDHSITSGTVFFTPKIGKPGSGQVVPLKIATSSGTTSGLGRMHTISELGVLVVCTAEGSSTPHVNIATSGTVTGYQIPAKVSGTFVSPAVGSANDFRYVSNLPTTQFLRDGAGNIVGLSSSNTYITGGTNSIPSATPFPSNKTLMGTYSSSDPDTTGTNSTIALQPGYKRLQAMLLFEPSSPMNGFDLICTPDFNIAITGLGNLQIQGVNSPSALTPFAGCDGTTSSPYFRFNGVSQQGGINSFQYFLAWVDTGGSTNHRVSRWSAPSSTPSNYIYQFVSNPFTVPAGNIYIQSNGSPFVVQTQVQKKSGSGMETAQTFNVKFPNTTVASPDLTMLGLATGTSPVNYASDWWGFDFRIQHAANWPFYGSGLGGGCVIRTGTGVSPESSSSWSLNQTATVPITPYCNTAGVYASSFPASDVVRTLVPQDEDYRLTMAKPVVVADGNNDMVKLPKYNDENFRIVHTFMASTRSDMITGCNLSGRLVSGTYNTGYTPKAVNTTGVLPKDWDTGYPLQADGAYANKPDEGNIYVNGQAPYYNGENEGLNFSSYFTANRIIPSPVMFGSLPTGVVENVPWRTLQFRPRTTPSDNGATYKHDTLGDPPDYLLLDLFSMPVVEPYAISEPFSTAGKINMNYQIVPFTYINRSTALRAVLGSELIARVPLGAEQTRYVGSDYPYYKPAGNVPSGSDLITPPKSNGVSMARLPLNLDENSGTLKQFQDMFASWQVYRSPAEICDVYLVPKPYTWPGFDKKWYGNDFALVGDNVRERPYADIYPRLTTKSNTYTVHFRVQVLKNPSKTTPDTWNESIGAIVGEYRGSTTIERYLDPNNSSIKDYATDASAPSLDTLYHWRTVQNQAFNP